MKVSIVVVARNEEACIAQCLQHIDSEWMKYSGDCEVLVVDNGSTDQTASIVSTFGIRVVREPRKGITLARQAGFLASKGEIVAFIDADTKMPWGWLGRVLAEFDDPKVVAVTGPCRFYGVPLRIRVMADLFNVAAWLAQFVGAPIIQGGNFAVRRVALERINGFDTSIEFYGEDTDIAKRIAKVGAISWRWRTSMLSSGRRLVAEGAWTTGARYLLNWASILVRGRPATNTHQDIRS